MRGSIRCLLLGIVAVATLRHLSGSIEFAILPQTGGHPWFGALSFALAAVVETGRKG